MTHRPTVFVIMSFDESFDKIYHQAIKPAIEESGFHAVGSDEVARPVIITSEIIRNLFDAKYVIADVSTNSPNVFYELGVSHAIGNKTITITKDPRSLPFDIRTHSAIQYTDDRNGLRLLKSDILKSMREMAESDDVLPNNIVQEIGKDRWPTATRCGGFLQMPLLAKYLTTRRGGWVAGWM